MIYLFDMSTWMDGDNPAMPPPASRKNGRNKHWRHLNSMRILTMPDKWEYPWFAAWDLAFQCVTIALIDPGFSKDNLWFLLFEQFQHVNGQIPAYEWEFSDLNPPVHAWACWRVYQIEKEKTGKARPLVSGTLLPQAADQFCLVGEQGRQRRQQRIRFLTLLERLLGAHRRQDAARHLAATHALLSRHLGRDCAGRASITYFHVGVTRH